MSYTELFFLIIPGYIVIKCPFVYKSVRHKHLRFGIQPTSINGNKFSVKDITVSENVSTGF